MSTFHMSWNILDISHVFTCCEKKSRANKHEKCREQIRGSQHSINVVSVSRHVNMRCDISHVVNIFEIILNHMSWNIHDISHIDNISLNIDSSHVVNISLNVDISHVVSECFATCEHDFTCRECSLNHMSWTTFTFRNVCSHVCNIILLNRMSWNIHDISHIDNISLNIDILHVVNISPNVNISHVVNVSLNVDISHVVNVSRHVNMRCDMSHVVNDCWTTCCETFTTFTCRDACSHIVNISLNHMPWNIHDISHVVNISLNVDISHWRPRFLDNLPLLHFGPSSSILQPTPTWPFPSQTTRRFQRIAIYCAPVATTSANSLARWKGGGREGRPSCRSAKPLLRLCCSFLSIFTVSVAHTHTRTRTNTHTHTHTLIYTEKNTHPGWDLSRGYAAHSWAYLRWV